MIAIGSDHGGYALKCSVMAHLKKQQIEFYDFGCYSENRADYPVIAEQVGKAVSQGKYDKGILICGTGIGISIAANKIRGIRAAVCSDEYTAKFTRLHNNSNILCLGGRVIGPDLANSITDIFLTTGFEGGRHTERLNMIEELEKNF